MSEMCETMFDTRQSAPANGPLMWNVDLCLIISSSSLRTTIWAVAWSHPRSHLKFSIASVVRPLVTNHLSPWMGMGMWDGHQPPVTMDGNVRLSPTTCHHGWECEIVTNQKHSGECAATQAVFQSVYLSDCTSVCLTMKLSVSQSSIYKSVNLSLT